MRVAFIGAGTMAEAIISALLAKKTVKPRDVVAADVAAERLEALRQRHGIRAAPDNAQAVREADIVVLAVKPFQFGAVAADLKGRLSPRQTVLSIMAGVTMRSLREGLDHAPVVRAMPNTPAQIGEGMCAWTPAPEVPEEAREQVQAVVQATGKEVRFDDEAFLDMATAVSGSGPGFVFLLMESFIDGATQLGLPPETAREMVIQTFLGSARLAEKMGQPPSELRQLVTTPGGTTEQGLRALEEGNVRSTVAAALLAAYEKSKSLGSK